MHERGRCDRTTRRAVLPRRRRALARLGRAAALVIGALACSAEPSSRELAGGTPTAAPTFHFRRSGASRDLLCALARAAPGATPAGFGDLPNACGCRAGIDRCRLVGIGNDRRRALLLAPQTKLSRVVARAGASALRFSFSVRGAPACAVDVRVTLADSDGRPVGEWRKTVTPAARWVDGRIPLAADVARRLRVTIETAPLPAHPAAHAIALATPRLIRATSASAARAPTNVLVYLIDTLRPDHTSLSDGARPTTPRLARLAREGVAFENAYTVAPWTRPATASLLTGLYPSFHAVETNGSLALQTTTLAERFRRAGWSTWAFVANAHVFGEGVNLDQGFDRFVAVRGRKLDNHARSEEINEVLLPQLAAFGDEPFLLYVHAVDPHSPYDPPPSHRGRFRDPSYRGGIEPAATFRTKLRERELDESDLRRVRDLYDEDIAYQDEMLGVLLDRLAAEGLLERTIVVVLSDHGEELHDHGDWEHGLRLFEEQVRIPLVFSVPGARGAAGRRVAAPAQIVDVLPTLLALFGIPGGEHVQGVDLAPALAGRVASVAGAAERPVYCEELRPAEEQDLFSLRTGRWKIVREVAHASGEKRDVLFDLESDPLELHDLSSSNAARLAALRARLEAIPAALGAKAPALPAGAPAALSPATRRQLEALGYTMADERAPEGGAGR